MTRSPDGTTTDMNNYPAVVVDSAANRCVFGTGAHRFLIFGTLRECAHGSVIVAVGSSKERRRHRAHSLSGKHFLEHSPPETAIWSEVSSTYENGYTIIKGTDHGNGISYMPREEIVKIDSPSVVILDTTTIPGLYLIRPYYPSDTTHLREKTVEDIDEPLEEQGGQRDERSPHPSTATLCCKTQKENCHQDHRTPKCRNTTPIRPVTTRR
jgi:hypothetical protein